MFLGTRGEERGTRIGDKELGTMNFKLETGNLEL